MFWGAYFGSFTDKFGVQWMINCASQSSQIQLIHPSTNPSSPYVPAHRATLSFFSGRREEALGFYQTALGAETGMLMPFGDSPEPPPPGTLAPGFENKIMHASFRTGSTELMASDGCRDGGKSGGFSLSLAVETEAEADRYFKALAAGGKVTMPPGKTFWSPRFGMVQDRFCLNWMVGVTALEA